MPRALREAISHLLANPAEAERLGAAGRQAVLERHTLDDYTARVAAIVKGLRIGALSAEYGGWRGRPIVGVYLAPRAGRL